MVGKPSIFHELKVAHALHRLGMLQWTYCSENRIHEDNNRLQEIMNTNTAFSNIRD